MLCAGSYVIAAALIDMDGVLLDSEQMHSTAFGEVLRPFGVDVDYSTIAGMSTVAVFKDLSRRGLVPTDLVESLSAAKRTAAREYASRYGVRLIPGALECVKALANRMPVALCTSASPGTIRLMVRAGIDTSLFSAVISAEDVTNAKPSPEIYLVASSRLGLKPRNCVVIEDSVNGVEAGIEAGCNVIGVGPLVREVVSEYQLAGVPALLSHVDATNDIPTAVTELGG